MMTLKKQTTPGTRLTIRKRWHVGVKSGMTVRLIPHGKLSQTASFSKAVDRSIAATKKNGNPIAKYDVQRRQAYLEYPNGKRAYVD